jgi:cbb3-type cytochrome oxidase subunit 3
LAVVGEAFEGIATWIGIAVFIGLVWWLYRSTKLMVTKS